MKSITKTLHLISLGCSKNLVDSEVMLANMVADGYTIIDDATKADVIIVNTCGFIGDAKIESIDTILELNEVRKDGSKLIMAGCLSERYKDTITADFDEVDIFTGVGDYDKINTLLKTNSNVFSPKVYLHDGAERIITGSKSHAYIKLSEGCNQNCAFCAIPNFKGRLQSRTIASVVLEIQKLIAKGYWDFSLISQDTSSYGRDFGFKDYLIELIHALDEIPEFFVARVHYLYPSTTSTKLIETIAKSTKVQNYFDMPLQHINDKMLKTHMKRGSGKARIVKLLNAMKKVPNAHIRTAFIAGHPHEDEEAFSEMYEFIKDFGFDRVSVFGYFDEENTKAYNSKHKNDNATIKQRALKIKRLANGVLLKNSLGKLIGKTIKCSLSQSDEHELLLSAKPIFWTPDIDGEIVIEAVELENIENKPYDVFITKIAKDKLIGVIK